MSSLSFMVIDSHCEITGFYARTLIRPELLCLQLAGRHLQSFMWLNHRSNQVLEPRSTLQYVLAKKEGYLIK